MAEDPETFELYAYIDGQLDPERGFAVECRLADNPAQAAWVMGELSRKSALRLLASDTRSAPASLLAQAAALDGRHGRAMGRRSIFGVTAGAAAALVATLFVVADQPPHYVDTAVNSHRIAMLRARMDSQVETPVFDMREIATHTDIALPRLPAEWRVTDVQLFPTPEGPALLIAIRDNRDGQRLSLFAINADSAAPRRPDAVREGAQSVAYWRREGMSYALTGDAEPVAIDARAERLVRDWS